MHGLYGLAMPIGRLLLGALFLLAGFNKIMAPEGVMQMITGAKIPFYAQALPSPEILGYVVIGLEIVLGLFLIIGFWTRLSALILAGFCIFTAVVFHMDFADQMQTTMFMKNLAIAGGLLILFSRGAGALSVDRGPGDY